MNTFKQISFGLGNEMYVTPCIVCGESVKTWVKRQGVKFKCKECRAKEKEITSAGKSELKKALAERRMEIAVEHLEKKGLLDQYEEALRIVGSNLYREGWFQSSDEILVALELIRSGLKIRHQVKMGRWKVDFIVPELKVVLEVDGTLFHPKEKKKQEKVRDASIIASLGPEWEVVRINDIVLEKNIQKLVPAIKRVIKERVRVRSNFDHKLPHWYSDNQI